MHRLPPFIDQRKRMLRVCGFMFGRASYRVNRANAGLLFPLLLLPIEQSRQGCYVDITVLTTQASR